MPCRCDSYNTAQIQLLSGPHYSTNHALDLDSDIPTRTEDPSQIIPGLSRATSRGRSRLNQRDLVRSGNSAPPITSAREIVNASRNTHSVTPVASTVRRLSSVSGTGHAFGSDDTGNSEVDFCGGESPRSHTSISEQQKARDRTLSIDYDSGDGEDQENDDEDDSDEDMSDAEDLEDENCTVDRMEIFGHR